MRISVSETYPEQHPTPCENHFWDRVWLFRQIAILAFQGLKWNRNILCLILEPDH